MRQVETTIELRELLSEPDPRPQTGFVPTMGALHAGHQELIARAADDCERVVVSVFVNPTQFDDASDLATYPRDLASDAALAEEAGCDVFWNPTVTDLYPDGLEITTRVSDELTTVMCGAESGRGPDHFAGVTTIVSRLFEAVAPDVAYFGEKDAQQLAVIRRMTSDLDLPIEIRGVPTVRDQDGLALSSRNRRLDGAARETALAIPRALDQAVALAGAGERSATTLTSAVEESLSEGGIEVEYVEVRDPEDLSGISELNGRPALLAVAATVGGVRLIDNVILERGG